MVESPVPSTSTLVELASLIEHEGRSDRTRYPDDDVAMIRRADELRSRSHEALNKAVADARSHGMSWQAVGGALGVSRQAAFKRFGELAQANNRETSMSPGDAGLLARTEDVFRHLNGGDYETVRLLMTYTCARELGKRKLMGVWAQVISASGQLVSCRDTVAVEPSGTTAANAFLNRYLLSGPIVQTTLHHETGDWLGRVAYAGKGKIAGLLIAPVDGHNLEF